MMDQKLLQRVTKVLCSNRYLTLATIGPDGSWAAPLAYVIDTNWDLVFYSELQSRHMQDALRSHQVSGAVFNSSLPSDDVDGVQFMAIPHLVEGAELQAVMERYFRLSFPDPIVRARWARPVDDFEAPAPQRFVRLALTNLYLPDFSISKIDRRVEVPLSQLRATPIPK